MLAKSPKGALFRAEFVFNLLVESKYEQITCAAQAAGWTPRSAFEAAMHLRIHGVMVSEARAAFADCRRVTQ
jgi:hypothetical protein